MTAIVDRSGEAGQTAKQAGPEGRERGDARSAAIAHTSLSIGEQSSHKLQNKFGSSSLRLPISEARHQAEVDDLFAQANWEKLS